MWCATEALAQWGTWCVDWAGGLDSAHVIKNIAEDLNGSAKVRFLHLLVSQLLCQAESGVGVLHRTSYHQETSHGMQNALRNQGALTVCVDAGLI
jgi:hypothetical protein